MKSPRKRFECLIPGVQSYFGHLLPDVPLVPNVTCAHAPLPTRRLNLEKYDGNEKGRTARLPPVLRAEAGHPDSAEYGPAPAASASGNLRRFLPSYPKPSPVSNCKRLRQTTLVWSRTTEHSITYAAANHNKSQTNAPDIFFYFISTAVQKSLGYLSSLSKSFQALCSRSGSKSSANSPHFDLRRLKKSGSVSARIKSRLNSRVSPTVK